MMACDSLVPSVSVDSLMSASTNGVQFEPPEAAFFTHQDSAVDTARIAVTLATILVLRFFPAFAVTILQPPVKTFVVLIALTLTQS